MLVPKAGTDEGLDVPSLLDLCNDEDPMMAGLFDDMEGAVA